MPSLILSHLNVTLLSPLLTPRVLNDEVVLVHSDHQNSVIQLLSTRSVSGSVNTRLVKHHILLSLYCHGNRINSQELHQSILSILAFLHWLILFQLKFLFNGICIACIVSSSIRIRTGLGHFIVKNVFENVLRHSSLTSVVSVLLRAIHDFLLTQNSQVFIGLVLDLHGGLNRSYSGKGVARSTLSLILNLAHSVLSQPIYFFRFLFRILQMSYFLMPLVYDWLH